MADETLFPDGVAQAKSAFRATVDNPRILADGSSTDDGSPTLLRMVNQIKDELDRPDLDGAVRSAIAASIGFWQRQRFFFNEGVCQFTTVPGQAGCGGADLADQPVMLAIDSAILLDDGGNVWSLSRVPILDLETISDQAQRSVPTCYAPFAQGFRFYPVPDRAYTVRMTGHVLLGMPATDADGNAWTDTAYDLIASYAKRYLAIQRLRDPALKAMMDVAVQEASVSLKGLNARRTGTGMVRSYGL